MGEFTHVDENGTPKMVDVSLKLPTKRVAHARATIELTEEICSHFKGEELYTKKGPVFQTAIIAGTMALKKTSELIPFCHPIAIEGAKLQANLVGTSVVIDCVVNTSGKTGVEMEALMGAQMAALTIYDMCKSFGHHMEIKSIHLVEKKGGKSDFKRV